MHLVQCNIPQEPLEAAPRTALLAERTEGECWDGFWSSDTYYARCTKDSGDVEWFVLVDEETPVSALGSSPEARVLPLRLNPRRPSRVSVVVAQSPSGQRMLVGGTARRSGR